MNNRIPLFALGAIVLLAIIWRIASPPPPTPPGPLGKMPGWYSGDSLGKMGPSAVNPSGTLWAGAWNQKTSSGKIRSAVWVIDFAKEEHRVCTLPDGSYASSLSWADDNTIQVLGLNAMKPEDAEISKIVAIDARDTKVKDTVELKTPVARILAWGDNQYLAELAGDKSAQVAVLDSGGNVQGKTVSVDADRDAKFGTVAAVSGDTFVFSEAGADGEPAYYLGSAQTGEAKPMFRVTELPGRVEGILLNAKNSAGAGVVVYTGEKFETLLYDSATGKIKGEADAAAMKAWDVHPFKYVTYQGGFDYKYKPGKPAKLFDFSKTPKRDQYWVSNVDDGRLYQRKDGSYISVSQTSDLIDIRIINKDGTRQSDLLPRR